MIDGDEPRAKKASEIVVGADLSAISVEELEERISMLKAEIARLIAEIDKKQSSKASAESFFRS